MRYDLVSLVQALPSNEKAVKSCVIRQNRPKAASVCVLPFENKGLLTYRTAVQAPKIYAHRCEPKHEGTNMVASLNEPTQHRNTGKFMAKLPLRLSLHCTKHSDVFFNRCARIRKYSEKLFPYMSLL